MPNKFSAFLKFEVLRLRKHPVFILGAVFCSILFVYIAIQICSNSETIIRFARSTQDPQNPEDALPLLLNLFTGNYLKSLLGNPAPLLTLFHYSIFLMLPLLVMLLTSDQIASDSGKKQLRFILPRISRKEYFFNRTVANILVNCVCLAAFVFLIDICITLKADSGHVSANLLYALKGCFFLFVYSISLGAVMTFANSFISNSFLTCLFGIGMWVIIVFISYIGSLSAPAMINLCYLFPSSIRTLYFEGGTQPVIAIVVSLFYAVAFYMLGWIIFKRRDV